jgi:hypothetical protein
MCDLRTLELWGWCFAFLSVSKKYPRYPVLCCSVWIKTERLVSPSPGIRTKCTKVWFELILNLKKVENVEINEEEEIFFVIFSFFWLICKPRTRYYYKDFSLICSVWICKYSRYSNSLWAGRSGDRIPLWARFSAPVQTIPGFHLASYTMGSESFPRVMWPGRGVDYPPHLAPTLKKK